MNSGNINMAKARLSMILTEEEMERLTFAEKEIKNKKEISADVHGLSTKKAKQFLKNIINTIMDTFYLIVIHGYTHGTAIRDMIWTTKELGQRAGKPTCPDKNYGRTVMEIAAAV